MKKKLLLALLALSSIVACTDIKDTEAPTIKDFGVTATDTTIILGSKINFAPVVVGGQNNNYTWLVGKAKVSQDPQYTFVAEKTGSFVISYSVNNSVGLASRELTVRVKKYIGGYYIINEGQFGKTMGSINYFDPKSKKLVPQIYAAANPSLTLGNTSCYAAQWQDRLYFVSKQAPRLVSADALSLESKGSLDNLSGADGRAFVGVDDTWGVITTSKGAYRVSLNPLAVGNQLDKTANTQCGGAFVVRDNLFVILANKGVNIYNIKDNYKFIKNHPKGAVGFAQSKDGALWAGDGNTLIKIDPSTLDITEIPLPTGVSFVSSWGAWNAGSLCASTKENWLYFVKGGQWGGGREIYRYKIGDITSLNQVFATSTVADDAFYGSGITVDPQTGNIMATFVKDGWGDSYKDNRLVTFDGVTGAETSRFTTEGFWFPTMILANN